MKQPKFTEIKISQDYLIILHCHLDGMEPGLRVGGESQLARICEVTTEVTEELQRARLISEQMPWDSRRRNSRGGEVKWELEHPAG